MRSSRPISRSLILASAPRRLYSPHFSPTYRFLKDPRTVSVVGVPISHGQPLKGVEKGPNVIRENDLASKLKQDGWVVEDKGNISFEINVTEPTESEKKNKIRFASILGPANERLQKITEAEHRKGNFVLCLGGDHSLGIGSLAGALAARPETGFIWVDAHADINTPATSISGNIHGQAVSYLMNFHHTKKIKGFEWLQQVPDLLPHRLCYVGLRDLDDGEKKFIRDLGIKAYTMQDVDRYGIGAVMARAIDHICTRVDRPLHLSFDIDSVDPAFAPSTGTRVRGGLSYREAYFIAESMAETGLLTSMDMVEVNPSLASTPEDAKATVDMATGLICSALGNRIL